MNRVETGTRPKLLALQGLCPRIIVFRLFVDQLPKLDVAGSTPVPRSFFSSALGTLDRADVRHQLVAVGAGSDADWLVLSRAEESRRAV